ncbi:NAD(P)-dependent oxidoreductase [Falsochrobactrum shanghaiense]|uniref:NAD(P)-dependent oxidoreductase n=1 Tax=Falsochrobactrum shanghaiense TaxID=2201899 RepID=A0A316J7U2_9HYPH|nr:SDR family oxidoreductase [Falsochrobactrum shanghaiense]PWL17228.1 NAD(P)-dependent oxidoreductase [Falsochrobactrum shanghaiense]
MRIFLLGAGYSAAAFARLMAGDAERIDGTTRHEERFAPLQQSGIHPWRFDRETSDPELVDQLARSTHVVISIAPGESGDPSLPLVEEAMRRPDNIIRWLGYLSTVGVYGDHQGGWVDETAPCKPVSRRSLERVHAEAAWTVLSQRHGVPLSILRLSGIYGPGRNAFLKLEQGTARRIIKQGQVFNRIHADDIAGALRLLAGTTADGIFNITDNEPAPPQDVIACAAEIMGITPPEEVAFESADMTPMARSFYGENKRVSNRRIKDLGYEFIYPDYRAALSAMWRDKNWR